MKYLNISFLFAMILLITSCGPEETTRFFVEGSCEECKALIEQALNNTEGVVSAEWNLERSQATVTFRANAVSADQVQQAVSDLGFNTEFFDGNPNNRGNLPACCTQPIQRKLKEDLPAGHH
ncbi:heavy-metal-associated domain-containing protein [Pontibacter sp. G13]|uniref:heavy-metal-associated domain-containing protein n=1 Tax=Pontibacter sp. G13 TaxID=3074898 RepID=UPI00288A455E|nr:heavy-metal-associated domain-containing protein [Pontibacter sp. G13]WNJ18507.1 heavy-metal-associated domain-containing protein [Pontibacter sp. G13]